IEDELARGGAARADRAAAKHRPVGEDEKRCVLVGHLWKRIRKAGKALRPSRSLAAHYTGRARVSEGLARRTCRRGPAACRAAISRREARPSRRSCGFASAR